MFIMPNETYNLEQLKYKTLHRDEQIIQTSTRIQPALYTWGLHMVSTETLTVVPINLEDVKIGKANLRNWC